MKAMTNNFSIFNKTELPHITLQMEDSFPIPHFLTNELEEETQLANKIA